MGRRRTRRRSRSRSAKASRQTWLAAVFILLLGALAVVPALQGESLADLLNGVTDRVRNGLPDAQVQTPTGPGDLVPEPGGQGDEPLAEELGGFIDYGEVVQPTGQRTGITAVITAEMIAAADRDELGSEADSDIRPPGFDDLPQRNRARGHLLGRQLGGSGDVDANLVALYQSDANSPVMRDYENEIAAVVEAGQTVRYQAQPIYDGPDDSDEPRAIRLRAQGDQGFRLDVEIENSPEAPVTEHVAPSG
jgi:hypothetical protein